MRSLLLFAVLCALVAPIDRVGADEWDPAVVQDLRARGRYGEAERYCREKLADRATSDEGRLDLTIELIRTLADHARETALKDQEPLWTEADALAAEFLRDRGGHPRAILVEARQAITRLDQGETLRLYAALADGDARERPRVLLTGAIGQLQSLDERVAADAERAGQRPGDQLTGGFNVAQLNSLSLHLRYQLGRGWKNLALCFDAPSPDRADALQRAAGCFAVPARKEPASGLVWHSRLEEIACHRLLGELETARRQLSTWKAADPAEEFAARLEAEGIRLDLAAGRLREALANEKSATESEVAELGLARLEALLAAWRADEAQGQAADAAPREALALDQMQSLEKRGGLPTILRAEALWADTFGGQDASGGETVVRIGRARERASRHAEAADAYDRAAARFEIEGAGRRAVDARLAAARVERQRGNFGAARDRYLEIAELEAAEARASDAHLLAIYCEAQAARAADPANLERYEALLREHVAAWPDGRTASQAWWWLGRLREHQGAWQDAVRALSNVSPDHAQYLPALEAMARVSLPMLRQLRETGNANPQLARDLIRHFEMAMGPQGRNTDDWTAAGRAALLGAAGIWIHEIPGADSRAETTLRRALARSQDAAEAWQAEARRWLFLALVSQGKTDEALSLAREHLGDAARTIELIGQIEPLLSRALPDRRRDLADLGLRLVDELASGERSAAEARQLGQLRVRLLSASGRRDEAVTALENLAAEHPRDGQLHEDLAAMLTDSDVPDELRAGQSKWQDVLAKSRPGSPRWFRAQLAIAETHLKLGAPARAQQTIARVRAAHPDLGGDAIAIRFRQLEAACEVAERKVEGR